MHQQANHIFMYLKRLYKYHKGYFLLVMLFIAGQLAVNLKRGMVFSPFFHYGMYSQVIKPAASYQVFEVWVDGKMLQGKNFTPWQWDKIHRPLVYYAEVPPNNLFYGNEVKRLTAKINLALDSSHFVQPCNYPAFEKWYVAYLNSMLPFPVNKIELLSRDYAFTNGMLQPIASVHPLSELCR